MAKRVVQFGYRFTAEPLGMPIIDCRCIPNPYGKKDPAQLIRKDPQFEKLVADGVKLLQTWESIGVGCSFGVHRSGEVAKAIAAKTGAVIEKYHVKGDQ